MADIEATVVNDVERVNFRELLEPRMRKILMLGVVLAVLQQWCGINVIFYYAKDVFAAAGYQVSDILLNIVIIGLANLAFTFLAIATVDRWGRRPLMLAGWIGLTVIYLLIGGAYWLRDARAAGRRAGRGGHRLLRLHARAGDVGGAVGDLSEPHSRRGHVDCGVRLVDRLFHAHLLHSRS